MSDLSGQTVVLIGGSAGIGLETARLARAEGADVILTGRNASRLKEAGEEIGAVRTEAFDAADFAQLTEFFDSLPTVDHVLVTAGGPYYGPLAEFDFEAAKRSIDQLMWLQIRLAQLSVDKVRPGGTLLFMGGTGARRPKPGLFFASAMTASSPALVAGLALEITPVRVNLIAAGFVDTPLSATLLGDKLEDRREELRSTLPIRRVVGPADVAALAVHLMVNTALTGATYDIDGGQQLL